MMRRLARLPIRLWLGLALVIIVAAPALGAWGSYTGLTIWQQQRALEGQADVSAAQRFVVENVARWDDPAWQGVARRRLAALHVDVELFHANGRVAFATSANPFPTVQSAPAESVAKGSAGKLAQQKQLMADLAGVQAKLADAGTAATARQAMQAKLVAQRAADLEKQQLSKAGSGARGIEKFVIPDPYQPKGPALGSGLLLFSLANGPNWTWPIAGGVSAFLLLLLLTLVAIGWFVGRTVVRPLAAMSWAAQGIALGHFDVRLPASGVREVARASAALEEMSAALAASLQRQADLEQERRLFIGAITHDLRTPLFTLRAYLGGLRDGLATTPARAERYVEVCQEKADVLERLIADLFTFTRVEYLEQTPRCEPLELGALLRQAVEDLQPRAAAKGIGLYLEGPPSPCPLLGDRHLLPRAIENLLDNALRYTPACGAVSVRWGIMGRRLTFTIEDTGPGIAAQDLPHLFTPLYRGESSRNRQTGGAGLGLAIARRILQSHGGDLTAANRATGGATFSGTIPSA